MTFIGSKIVQKKLRILNTLPFGAFCMADTKYKINDYFFNFNTVFSFFSFLLIQLHIFPLYILFFP